ncbi:hypothetical protein [Corynebacterium vitaeruminis]|uniref:hypothetical protein n=1 Tax=Corynebacterium vitaeruminis TaxID=38305 RepID=UPI0023F4F51C|nr:hypothetical protein [Corynebacterium vitaeruminis]
MTIIGKVNGIISQCIGRGEHPGMIAEKLHQEGLLNHYWEQQAQIDHYERILDEIRAYRDDLIEYSKDGLILSYPINTIAQDLTEILEEGE